MSHGISSKEEGSKKESWSASANWYTTLHPLLVAPSTYLLFFVILPSGSRKNLSRSIINHSGDVVHAHEEYVLEVNTLRVLDQADIHPFMHQ
jgi:hypothetical protein